MHLDCNNLNIFELCNNGICRPSQNRLHRKPFVKLRLNKRRKKTMATCRTTWKGASPFQHFIHAAHSKNFRAQKPNRHKGNKQSTFGNQDPPHHHRRCAININHCIFWIMHSHTLLTPLVQIMLKKHRSTGSLPSGAQLQRKGRPVRDEVLACQSFLRYPSTMAEKSLPPSPRRLMA